MMMTDIRSNRQIYSPIIRHHRSVVLQWLYNIHPDRSIKEKTRSIKQDVHY